MIPLASEQAIDIPRKDFETMLRFARTVYALKDNPTYLRKLHDILPPAARIRPCRPSVLMGFDFHLTPTGPKLIEINNNAGGLYIGQDNRQQDQWIPQPSLPEMPGTLEERLLHMFDARWHTIVIMDEQVERQFMFPEMCAYARLLQHDGRQAWVVNPEELKLTDRGLVYQQQLIDAIYNRHTDFYLESAALADVRRAYEADQVALNPHPRSYALIGDKTRMVDWWRPGWLESCLDADSLALIRQVVPETHRLDETDRDKVWKMRKQLVFKPAARHGGKGVVLGKSMSRKRFESLDHSDTVVQQRVPPSSVELNGQTMKLDIRMYMHGSDLIALAGRVWRGQVTNFRQPGSGWVMLDID